MPSGEKHQGAGCEELIAAKRAPPERSQGHGGKGWAKLQEPWWAFPFNDNQSINQAIDVKDLPEVLQF